MTPTAPGAPVADAPAKANGGAANEASYYECLNHRLAAMVPADALRILDVGCGAGALGHHLKRAVPGRRVWGIEIIPDAGERARSRLDGVAIGDVETMTELPYEPGSFDCILFGDVLEHLVEPGQVLDRLAGLLAPGGSFVCCIPNVSHWSVVVQQLAGRFTYTDAGLLDRTHLRFFTATTFRELLEEHGFTVEAEEPLLFGRDDIVGPLADAAVAAGVPRDVATLTLSTYQAVFRARPAKAPPVRTRVVETLTMRTTTVVTVADGPVARATVDAIRDAGAGEVVVVATGSEVPTVPGPNVRVLRAVGSGFLAAAARGIEAATGSSIALLAGDVVPAAGWLRRLDACLRGAPASVVAVAPTTDRVSGPQLVDGYLPPAMWQGATPASVAAALTQHRSGESVPAKILEPGCVLLRRTAYDEIGGFDLDLGDTCGTLDLWWRLRAAGGHLRVVLDAFAHRGAPPVLDAGAARPGDAGTEALAAKLLAHHGRGTVPPAAELWGIDWFRPLQDPWRAATRFAVAPPWPDHGTLPVVLSTYVTAFASDDPVSLVVVVPTDDVDPDEALGAVARLLEEGGHDLDAVPDIAITPLAPGHERDPGLVWLDGTDVSVEGLRAAAR